jgi:two-component system response regulator AtoC
MESELFGHVKGAFTGADKARKGLFLEAHEGTIFLDEIGELPMQVQVKLLHILEDKSVRAVGSEQARSVNVRIIAATNRDLAQMVREGKFREDLYFRLSAFQILVPPLRARGQDLPRLVDFLLQRSAQRMSLSVSFAIDQDAADLLARHDWPGNVRELEHVIDRALILAENGHISMADLPPQIAQGANSGAEPGSDAGDSLREQLRRFEFTVISKALAETGGDRKLAAQKLGIGLSSLYRKLDEIEVFMQQPVHA